MPTTWPVREQNCPVLNVTPASGQLGYDEGIYIGYRAWQQSGVPPRYQFGHGLGYTSWAYEEIAVSGRQVSVTVRNAGGRAGREVVQVYLAPVQADGTRPVRWLAGFASVTAEPGQTTIAVIDLPERTFQLWDDGWRTVTGDYVVEAAHSIADVRLSGTLTVG